MHPKNLVVLLVLVSVFGYGQEYHPLLSNSGWCCEKCFGTGCVYDTIIGIYLVTEIDTVSTLAGNRKRWFLNLTDSLTTSQGTLDRNLIWIEGIGATYGPIYSVGISNAPIL